MALSSARSDYKSASIGRTVKNNLPIAWKKLIEEQDRVLIDLISEKVAALCGYKPELDVVSAFLADQLQMTNGLFRKAEEKNQFPRPLSPDIPSLPVGASWIGFILNRERIDVRKTAEVLVKVLEEFSTHNPIYFQRFAARKHGRTERYVAKTRAELYPDWTDLSRYSKQLSSGWWEGTNYSTSKIHQILELSAEVADLRLGHDLVINLGN